MQNNSKKKNLKQKNKNKKISNHKSEIFLTKLEGKRL